MVILITLLFIIIIIIETNHHQSIINNEYYLWMFDKGYSLVEIEYQSCIDSYTIHHNNTTLVKTSFINLKDKFFIHTGVLYSLPNKNKNYILELYPYIPDYKNYKNTKTINLNINNIISYNVINTPILKQL